MLTLLDEFFSTNVLSGWVLHGSLLHRCKEVEYTSSELKSVQSDKKIKNIRES